MGVAAWLILSTLIIAVDQFTKLLIMQRFVLGDTFYVTSFFNIVSVHNTGAAFSIFATAGGWQRWFFTFMGVISIIFMIFLLIRHHRDIFFSAGVSMILGGAVGNVLDRILRGYVVDFIDLHVAGMHWPAFNIADSAIVCGVILLFADELFKSNQK